jgi:hypothetical protein
MSEQYMEEEEQEEVSNPYNRKKAWHKPDGPKRADADGLYYEEDDPDLQRKKATRKRKKKAAPDDNDQNTNYKKRYDDLKNHYDSKLSEFKRREQELIEEARKAEPAYQAPKSQEELARFRQEYPDLYDTVETVAHLRSQQEVEVLKGKLSFIEQREAEIVKREAEAALHERHPDFDEIRGNDNFHSWAKEQPDQIQGWIYDNPDDVTLAVKALDLYKLETGQGQQRTQKNRSGRRKQQKASAADIVSTKTTSVDARQPRIWTENEIAKMSLDQFDKHEEDIREAISEGRVRKG